MSLWDVPGGVTQLEVVSDNVGEAFLSRCLKSQKPACPQVLKRGNVYHGFPTHPQSCFSFWRLDCSQHMVQDVTTVNQPKGSWKMWAHSAP